MAILRQNERSHNHIELTISNNQTNPPFTWTNLLSNWAVFLFVYLAFTLSMRNMFDLKAVSPYIFLIGSIIVLAHHYLKEKMGKDYVVYAVVLIQLLIFTFLQTYIINGFFLSLNQVAEVVGHHTSMMLTIYDIGIHSNLYNASLNLFWANISILFALIVFYILRQNLNLVLCLFVLASYLLQLMTGIMPHLLLNVCLFIVLIIGLHRFFIKQSNHQVTLGSENHLLSLTISVLVAVILLGVAAIVFAITPIMEAKKPSFVTSIKNSATNTYEGLRFGKNNADSLPEGDFTKLAGLNLTDEVVLDVVMTEPTSYYLRGFVGATYTDEAWLDLDYETMYDNNNLFYWLEKEGFTPLQQLSLVSELGSSDEEHAKNQLVIHHKQAANKYLYTPYELNGAVNIADDLHYFTENHLQSKKFFGNKTYSYDASENLVKYYPRITNRLYESREDEAVQNYLALEAHYNAFVYEHYTKLTEEVESLFDLNMHQEIDKNDRISYEDAIDSVDELLEQLLNYDENVEKLPVNKDFITYTIETLQGGYAPHYATLATALFRYFDIPARYVEGYLITPEIVEGLEAYSPISVTGKEAHAWTEIYIDEVGWIPLEFTPAYQDVMEPTDMTEYPKGKWSNEDKERDRSNEAEAEDEELDDSNVAPIEEEDQTDNQANDNNQDDSLRDDDDGSSGGSNGGSVEDTFTEEPEEDESSLWKVLLVILLVLLLLCLLIYLIYMIKKRFELRKLKESFYDENLSHAILKLFSYTLLLFHYDDIKERKGSTHSYVKEIRRKYGRQAADEFKDIIDLAQAAAYSNRVLTSTEHEQVVAYKDEMLEKIKESKSFFEKLKMRWWDFIY